MNDKIKIVETEILSNQRYLLKRISFDYTKPDGSVEQQQREVFDRGNGATVLLYNKEQKTIILTRQFRLPTYINGNQSGMLLEVCAGVIDHEGPEECIRREAEEETGYRVTEVKKIYEAYMSPGSVTELLHYFVAGYQHDMKVGKGGGLEEEQEHIEVIEMPFDKAVDMMKQGEIRDAKTIILLQYALLNNLV